MTRIEPELPEPGPVATSVRRIAGNALSLFTSDVLNRATTFFIYVLVGRYLSVAEFGQLSLGLALLYTFQVLAAAGMETLVTREIAHNRALTGRYLLSIGAVVTVFSVLAYGVLWGFVSVMNYAPATARVILLLGLGLLPFALSTILEAVFKAWERMHLIVWAHLPANVLKLALAFAVLSSGGGLVQVVWVLLGARVAIALIEGVCLFVSIGRPEWRVDATFASGLVRRTLPFLGIDGTIAAWSSMAVILLSKLMSETEVGLYSSAGQIVIPTALVFQSLMLSVFPLMCRQGDSTGDELKVVLQRMVQALIAVAVPATLVLALLGDRLLLLLFGNEEFGPAARVLQLLSFNLILMALTHVMGRALYARHRERTNLRIVALDLVVNLVLGILFITRFGLIGAALAAVATRSVDYLQHYFAVRRVFGELSLLRKIWPVGLAGAAMAATMLLLADRGLLPPLIASAMVYASILGACGIWLGGGWRRVATRLAGPGGHDGSSRIESGRVGP